MTLKEEGGVNAPPSFFVLWHHLKVVHYRHVLTHVMFSVGCLHKFPISATLNFSSERRCPEDQRPSKSDSSNRLLERIRFHLMIVTHQRTIDEIAQSLTDNGIKALDGMDDTILSVVTTIVKEQHRAMHDGEDCCNLEDIQDLEHEDIIAARLGLMHILYSYAASLMVEVAQIATILVCSEPVVTSLPRDEEFEDDDVVNEFASDGEDITGVVFNISNTLDDVGAFFKRAMHIMGEGVNLTGWANTKAVSKSYDDIIDGHITKLRDELGEAFAPMLTAISEKNGEWDGE